MPELDKKESIIRLQEKHFIEAYKDKDELPRTIRLEASTICQLNCPCCYMRNDKNGVQEGCGLGFLSFENFKKIVDDNYFESIELSNSGEIFLNPELIKIIEYSYLNKIKLFAENGVNLNNLSDELAEALVKYQFEEIVASIDGASQETYAKYRVNGNYDKVIENIKKIIYYKEKYKSDLPLVKWKFIVFGHNEHEIKLAKIEAKKLGIPIFFSTNWVDSFSPIKDVETCNKETGIQCKGNVYEIILEKYRNDKTQWFYCKELWTKPQINWDGQILGCCNNHKFNFGGNAFKDGLLKALNHPRMIYTKNMLTKNAEIIDNLPCSNCDCLKKMQEHDFWIQSPIE